MIDLRTLGVIALGGALGSVARFLVQDAFLNRYGSAFPYGTLFVNVLGSFVIGVIAEVWLVRPLDQLLRTFLIVGILGGFTTFSSFSLEALQLARAGDFGPALLYVGASVILGLLAAAGGMAAARTLIA